MKKTITFWYFSSNQLCLF